MYYLFIIRFTCISTYTITNPTQHSKGFTMCAFCQEHSEILAWVSFLAAFGTRITTLPIYTKF